MRGITGRFVLLIATAAVLPLVGYGLWSVKSLGAGTEKSVTLGNQAVAEQIAGRVKLYFDNNVRVLTSIGAELQSTQLQIWQQERVLRNHVLDFREFREITVFDGSGRVRVTSRVGKTVLTVPEAWRGRDTTGDAFYVATPHMDADALPTTTIAVPLENAAWIVAEISLEELWRTVDRIRVGTEGYALLIDQQGKFIAHGNPNDKELIASGATAAAERAEAGRIGTPQHLVRPIRQNSRIAVTKTCLRLLPPSRTPNGRSSSSSRRAMHSPSRTRSSASSSQPSRSPRSARSCSAGCGADRSSSASSR